MDGSHYNFIARTLSMVRGRKDKEDYLLNSEIPKALISSMNKSDYKRRTKSGFRFGHKHYQSRNYTDYSPAETNQSHRVHHKTLPSFDIDDILMVSLSSEERTKQLLFEIDKMIIKNHGISLSSIFGSTKVNIKE